MLSNWLAPAFLAIVLALSSDSTANKPVRPVHPGPAGARAYAGLGTFYQGRANAPDYSGPLDSLISGAPAVSREAGEYLLALYQQSLADERNGRAEWRVTPYFNGGPESQARAFRLGLAKAIGGQSEGPNVIPILEWAFSHEPLSNHLRLLAEALPRLPMPDATDFLRHLLARPHLDRSVLMGALGAARRARAVALRPEVAALCANYRHSVRDSAQSVARSLGVRNPAGFDAGHAFDLEIDRVLRDVGQRLRPTVPADARWCIVISTPSVRAAAPDTVHGWLVSEDAATRRIVDGSGVLVRVTRATSHVDVESLGDYAHRLIRVRARDPESLSREGSLTAQFEPEDVSLVEANVAAWCYLKGERVAAANLLFPRVDAMGSLSDFEAAVRELAGHQAHLSMLAAFSYDRDYPTAIAWGDHLSKAVFDGYESQDRGRELAGQLRTRRTDFHEFALPDSVSWVALRRRLTRAEQIRYLAEHLRLLNCFQWGQPGGVSLEEPQYAEASHQRAPFDEVENQSARLINPLVELGELELTIRDIPALLPFLADRSFLPTFGFWRDFHPDRHLYRVCDLVQGEVNGIARQPLVDASYYATLADTARATYVARARAWCGAHAERSETELDLETLATTTVQNLFWATGDNLAKRGEPGATPIILRRMDEFPSIRSYVTTQLRMLHAADAVPRARIWVARPFDGVPVDQQGGAFRQLSSDRIRFEAGLLLLQHAAPGTHEGWSTLLSLLEPDPERFWRWQAPRAILETKDSLALNWMCSHMSVGESFGNMDQWEVWRDLIRCGCEPLMTTFLEGMSSDSVTAHWPGSATSPGPRTYLFADRVAQVIAPLTGSPAVFNPSADDSSRANQRDHLRRWFAQRVEAFRGGARPQNLFR
jgi:hypothetical protein